MIHLSVTEKWTPLWQWRMNPRSGVKINVPEMMSTCDVNLRGVGFGLTFRAEAWYSRRRNANMLIVMSLSTAVQTTRVDFCVSVICFKSGPWNRAVWQAWWKPKRWVWCVSTNCVCENVCLNSGALQKYPQEWLFCGNFLRCEINQSNRWLKKKKKRRSKPWKLTLANQILQDKLF